MVNKGLFREDLFYRINLIQVELPPLRMRTGDITLLAHHFVREKSLAEKLPKPELTKEAMSSLKQMNFPGNIRELKNTVERAVLLCTDGKITETDFQQSSLTPQNTLAEGKLKVGLVTLEEMEATLIRETMQTYKGNVSKVARSLGLSRGALYRRLDKYDIPYDG